MEGKGKTNGSGINGSAKEGGCLVPASKGEGSCPSDGDAAGPWILVWPSHACPSHGASNVSRITGLGVVRVVFRSVMDLLQMAALSVTMAV